MTKKAIMMTQWFRRPGLRTAPVTLAIVALAMLPVAPASGMMTIELCNAEGETRTLSIPVEKDDDRDGNCAQPCHACLSRKSADKAQRFA